MEYRNSGGTGPGIQLDRMSVLVIDDEPNIRKTIQYGLADHGIRYHQAPDEVSALRIIGELRAELVFLDLKLGESDGMELIKPILVKSPQSRIVVITAHGSIESAVQAMKLGAFDYLPKPFTLDQIRETVLRVARLNRMKPDSRLNSADAAVTGLPDPASRNPGFRTMLSDLQTAAGSDAIILLEGESGTGKSLLAKHIHLWSSRRASAFITLSCPAVPSELLESDLFGHRRGAFTGAVSDQPGRIEACEGGTLFLDEIGELPLGTQAKMLRFIQEREYERVGEPVTRKADVRIVAATNRSLEEEVRRGRFREDLFYRLEVLRFRIPSLRNRREDIPDLLEKFLSRFSRQYGKPGFWFSPESLVQLAGQEWPGNVRQLENFVERLVIMNPAGELDPTHLPLSPGVLPEMLPEPSVGNASAPDSPVSLRELEISHISGVLSTTSSLQEAAEILGIDVSTLWRKRRQYGL